MPTVLIADDDPVSLGFLQTATESLGCAAVTAANGAQALELADAKTFDLLLLDLNMPDIDGPACCTFARTRHARSGNRHECRIRNVGPAALLAAGFAGHLEKPASLETIEALLRNISLDSEASPH
jgi:CheY-like chemotaxis protein